MTDDNRAAIHRETSTASTVTWKMLPLLKRHRVEVLLDTGHTQIEFARLAGVTQRYVCRIGQDKPIEHVDDGNEQKDRGVGRGRSTAAVRPFVGDLLDKEPRLMSLEILRRTRSKGYPGGKTVIYEMIASLRPKRIDVQMRFEGLPGALSALSLMTHWPVPSNMDHGFMRSAGQETALGRFHHRAAPGVSAKRVRGTRLGTRRVEWDTPEFSQHHIGLVDVRLLDGTKRGVHFFASPLKWLQWAEATLVPNQKAEALVRTLADHFAKFDRVPLLAVFNRPTTVALNWKRNGEVTQWYSAFAYTAMEMGFGTEVCWPYQARHNGCIEDLVSWTNNSIFQQRRFDDERDLQTQLGESVHELAARHKSTYQEQFERKRPSTLPRHRAARLGAISGTGGRWYLSCRHPLETGEACRRLPHLRKLPMILTRNKSSLTECGNVLHDPDLADHIVDRTFEPSRLIIMGEPSARTRHIRRPAAGHQPDDPARISAKDRPEFPEPAREPTHDCGILSADTTTASQDAEDERRQADRSAPSGARTTADPAPRRCGQGRRTHRHTAASGAPHQTTEGGTA